MDEIKKFTELEIVRDTSIDKPEYCEENVPYFCIHSEQHNGYSGYGRVIKTGSGFTLVDIGLNKEAVSNCTSVQTDSSLKALVDNWCIKRIKGKITLFVGDGDYE